MEIIEAGESRRIRISWVQFFNFLLGSLVVVDLIKSLQSLESVLSLQFLQFSQLLRSAIRFLRGMSFFEIFSEFLFITSDSLALFSGLSNANFIRRKTCFSRSKRQCVSLEIALFTTGLRFMHFSWQKWVKCIKWLTYIVDTTFRHLLTLIKRDLQQ